MRDSRPGGFVHACLSPPSSQTDAKDVCCRDVSRCCSSRQTWTWLFRKTHSIVPLQSYTTQEEMVIFANTPYTDPDPMLALVAEYGKDTCEAALAVLL